MPEQKKSQPKQRRSNVRKVVFIFDIPTPFLGETLPEGYIEPIVSKPSGIDENTRGGFYRKVAGPDEVELGLWGGKPGAIELHPKLTYRGKEINQMPGRHRLGGIVEIKLTYDEKPSGQQRPRFRRPNY